MSEEQESSTIGGLTTGAIGFAAGLMVWMIIIWFLLAMARYTFVEPVRSLESTLLCWLGCFCITALIAAICFSLIGVENALQSEVAAFILIIIATPATFTRAKSDCHIRPLQ